MPLVGIGGSGRKSLATFATKLLKLNLWRIRVTKTFTVRDFQEELKQHIVKAGKAGSYMFESITPYLTGLLFPKHPKAMFRIWTQGEMVSAQVYF